MNDLQDNFDVAIIGAGLVGASLALALNQAAPSLNIALLDPHWSPHYDQVHASERAIALSWGSIQWYQSLGLWSQWPTQKAIIDTVHVSNAGHLGVLRMRAQKAGVPALGHVLSAASLRHLLQSNVCEQSALTVFSQAVSAVQRKPEHWLLHSETGHSVRAKFLVVADGAHSHIKQQLAWPTVQHDYHQMAINLLVRSSKAHQQVAYERFTPEGPIALLPTAKAHESAVVWMVPTEQAETLAQQSISDVCHHLQRCFGTRLGTLSPLSEATHIPVQGMHSRPVAQPGVVLLGNAANTLYPAAGQGLNLALRDAAILTHLLSRWHQQQQSINPKLAP